MKVMESHQRLKFVLSIAIISCNQFFIGCGLVFSSILFVQLREPSSSIVLNAEESSWVAGIAPLVSPLGFFIIGILADKIGRLKAIQVSYIPLVVSWTILAFANSYEIILIGRIIGGLVFGSGAGIYVYVAEVCRPERRQLSFSAMSVFVGVGMMVECVMAMFVDWRTISATFAAMAVVSFAMLFALPESPVWLRARGRDREAETAEQWFGLEPGASAAVKVAAADGVADGKAPPPPPPPSWWSVYARRTVCTPAMIAVTFVACQQGTGLYVMIFYTADVLRDFGVRWDGVVVSMFMAVSRVVGSVVFSMLYDVKRKTLAVVSCAGMAVSLIVLIAYAKAFKGVDRASDDTVSIVLFTAYMFFGLVGTLPLPWTLSSEVFPRNVRGTMNGLVLTIGHLMMFLVVKVYPSMVSNFGIENVWIIFTTICLASVLFCIFIMPETKGIPLKDILASFESRKKPLKKNESYINRSFEL